jgi:CO/xanthine dehydrogenase FAD-binding subunit
MKKNILEEGEFLLKVILPEDASQREGCYQKLRVRESWDFPEAGIAASWIPGQYETLQIASTALESIPKEHSEQVRQHLDSNDGSIDVKSMSISIQKSVKPVNNTALPPRYRKSMVNTLTKRALKGIMKEN